MESKLDNQMIGAIGEQLVCANLIAHGWPAVNVNSSIKNFKGIDLYCQHGIGGIEATEVAQIQVKTTSQGEKAGIPIGITSREAADLEYLRKTIKGPWVFVNVKRLVPLDVDYYILTAKQLIELAYGLHHWYLDLLERRPCTESLEKSVACISIEQIKGNHVKSRFSDTHFENPMRAKVPAHDNWDNIWKKD